MTDGKMSQEKYWLRKAARMWGVQPDYVSFDGKPIAASAASIKKVLSLVSGMPVEGISQLKAIAEAPRLRSVAAIIDPVTVAHDEDRFHLRVHLPSDVEFTTLEAVIDLESVDRRTVSAAKTETRKIINVGGQSVRQLEVEFLCDLPAGYHKMQLRLRGEPLATTLILRTPAKDAHRKPKKTWGVFAPLYALRSAKDWGMGSLRELSLLQQKAAQLGGSFVGILPLLALDPADVSASPYSPVTRLFWNEMYLDLIELIADRPNASIQISEETKTKIRQLQDVTQVDYQSVREIKKPLLMALAKDFFATSGDQSAPFQYFVLNCPLVEDYAKFMAKGDQAEYKYHLYVQFKMDQSLQAMGRKAREGAAAGLYLDYPVGTSPHGFDQQRFAKSFVTGLSAGAPPDLMFKGGQNWGFAPMHPSNIRENRYEYFVQSLRQHARFASVLRLDHVMGLSRIYTIPEGASAAEGVYIRFRHEDLFAILNIEAHRADVQVVGENLGTVSPAVNHELEANNCCGMWVYPFEAGKDPKAAITRTNPKNLACLNTHDLSPFAGYIQGKDIELYERLGVFKADLAKQEAVTRKASLATWLKSFAVEEPAKLAREINLQMAAGPAEMLLINLEDLWGETEPQNVPGTSTEYANWKRKFSRTNEDWFNDHKLNQYFESINEHRGRA